MHSSIEYINTTMRSIRKVQNDCSLLKICMDDPTIQETVYDGYIFDKLIFRPCFEVLWAVYIIEKCKAQLIWQ